MKKRILIMALGMFLGLGCVSTEVFASQQSDSVSETTVSETGMMEADAVKLATGDVRASGQCGTTLYWSLSQSGVMTISGTGAMWNYCADGFGNDDYHECPWEEYKENITEVVFEEGITSVGAAAFAGCSNLRTVTFCDTIIKMCLWAFEGCTKLQNLELPNNLQMIDDQVFEGCTGITTVTIPDSVYWLGSNAFFGCTSLVDVYIGGSTDVPYYAYGTYAFCGCTSLKTIRVSEANMGVQSIDGVLYGLISQELYQYPLAKSDSVYVVEEGTSAIHPLTFAGTRYLEELILPDGLEVISGMMCSGSLALKTVTIPDGVTKIEGRAFEDCPKLETLEVPASVTEIDATAFYGTDVTLYVYDGSYAMQYAMEQGMSYYIMDGENQGFYPGTGDNDTSGGTSGGNTSETPDNQPADDAVVTDPEVSSSNVTGKDRFVALLYENVLERYAKQSEIASWVQELENGKTGAEVAFGFLFSEEFTNKNLSNSDYVERLYMSMMGRASDAGGKSDWVTHLSNGVSRLYVFKQFIGSAEFTNLCEEYGIIRGDVALGEARDVNYDVTRFVARNYSEFLGRAYDVSGLNDWTSRINNREQTMQEIASGFVFSQECTNMNLSNEEYVQMLYRGCFDRPGDEAGVADWVSQLNSGTKNREEVFWGFANSQEFANMVSSYGL